MNKAAIYHRPESEFAYLYAKNLCMFVCKHKNSDVEKSRIILWRSLFVGRA